MEFTQCLGLCVPQETNKDGSSFSSAGPLKQSMELVGSSEGEKRTFLISLRNCFFSEFPRNGNHYLLTRYMINKV